VHQAIIELLINSGSQVSLIGDPNQGIYEFAGANGMFLAQYGKRFGASTLDLTRNYRSVPSILNVANKLSKRSDVAYRDPPEDPHGAFFVTYKSTERDKLVDEFRNAVLAAKLRLERSAVLCRGRDMAERLAGNEGAPGQGTVKKLAQAAILRDKNRDCLSAFRLVSSCVVALLDDPPQNLVARITQPARYPGDRALRRLVWAFARNPDSGLPDAALIADTQWHPQLKARMETLLATIEKDFNLASADNLGRKLARTDLHHAPLFAAGALIAEEKTRIRIDTVHQAKGESLDAVLYLTTKQHAQALLTGVSTEVGRIGYVAVTRARNLLWLGIPSNALAELKPDLLACGFQQVGNVSS
jgi:superfamily I DNA/RNA helicase